MQIGDTISLGWCDNGTVEGKFVETLATICLNGPSTGYPITNTIRVGGNQIARQRQILIDHWYNVIKTDWLFWIDSDIFIEQKSLITLFNTADKDLCPIVSGIYFIAKDQDGSLPVIFPCIFNDIDEFSIQYCHPLPENKIMQVDCAGMGLVVMHRDVVTKLKEKYGEDAFLFAESNLVGDKFIGEDISFFRKCKETKIPIHAHTGVIGKHIKRVVWDLDYYNLYWGEKQNEEEIENTPPD
jgi:hypothetical protein